MDLTWWNDAAQYGRIKRYACNAGLAHWVAAGDQVQGWARKEEDQSFVTNGAIKLSVSPVLEKPRNKLRTMQRLKAGEKP